MRIDPWETVLGTNHSLKVTSFEARSPDEWQPFAEVLLVFLRKAV
jgi:hypothetical protein